jgi:L-rhamnose mutarotase
MQRAAFVLRIKPGRVHEYVEAHRAVWPELLDAISASGIGNYTIFLHEASAFGYLESEDLDASWSYPAAQDVNRRWQNAMADLLDARVGDEGPAMLDEIFRLD